MNRSLPHQKAHDVTCSFWEVENASRLWSALIVLKADFPSLDLQAASVTRVSDVVTFLLKKWLFYIEKHVLGEKAFLLNEKRDSQKKHAFMFFMSYEMCFSRSFRPDSISFFLHEECFSMFLRKKKVVVLKTQRISFQRRCVLLSVCKMVGGRNAFIFWGRQISCYAPKALTSAKSHTHIFRERCCMRSKVTKPSLLTRYAAFVFTWNRIVLGAMPRRKRLAPRGEDWVPSRWKKSLLATETLSSNWTMYSSSKRSHMKILHYCCENMFFWHNDNKLKSRVQWVRFFHQHRDSQRQSCEVYLLSGGCVLLVGFVEIVLKQCYLNTSPCLLPELVSWNHRSSHTFACPDSSLC